MMRTYRVLSRIFGLRKRRQQEDGINRVMRSFTIFALHQIITGLQMKGYVVDGACSLHGVDEK
jgi:hypothetical protein